MRGSTTARWTVSAPLVTDTAEGTNPCRREAGQIATNYSAASRRKICTHIR
jgi:hypothetical protein